MTNVPDVSFYSTIYVHNCHISNGRVVEMMKHKVLSGGNH
jgi:hypothetical protein